MNSTIDLSNKVIVITGATSGLGKETAKELAKMNGTLVILARNMTLAEEVKTEMELYSKNTKLDFIECDLSSLESIKDAAEEVSKKYPKVHALVNNAGIFNSKREVTKDGFESTFAVDYLSHFFLTLLLIDNLKAGSPSRIINVSSDIHLFFGLKMKDLQQEKRYRSQKAYGNAKAALVLHAYELHRRLDGTNVSVNAFQPGHVLTNMTRDTMPKFLTKIMRNIQSPEEAAKALVYVTASDEVANISGKYFQKFKIGKSSKQSQDTNLQRQLWDKSLEMIQEKIKGFKPSI